MLQASQDLLDFTWICGPGCFSQPRSLKSLLSCSGPAHLERVLMCIHWVSAMYWDLIQDLMGDPGATLLSAGRSMIGFVCLGTSLSCLCEVLCSAN